MGLKHLFTLLMIVEYCHAKDACILRICVTVQNLFKKCKKVHFLLDKVFDGFLLIRLHETVYRDWVS